MALTDPQREAEARIERARRTGAVELSLSGLGLTSRPESLGNLTQLESLDLLDVAAGVAGQPHAFAVD